MVWIPSEKILFAGCLAKNMASRNLGNTRDGDTLNYASTMRNVIKRFGEAQIVVPGHGNWGGLELLSLTLNLATQKH